MFGRKNKRQIKEEIKQQTRKGLLFWLPGGSSRLDVYLDYCVMRCQGKTKMPEKEREIPFTSILDVVYTPPTNMRLASLQLITKEMPDVKRSYWYAYENNLVVVHPSTEEIAHKVRAYILNPKGSNVIPPEYLNELRKELKHDREAEREAKAQAEREAKEAAKAAPKEEPPQEEPTAEEKAPEEPKKKKRGLFGKKK